MSALSQPCSFVKGWRFTTAGTPIAAGTDTIIDFTAAVDQKVNVNPLADAAGNQAIKSPGGTRTIVIFNDNASGGSAIFANLTNKVTGGAPADGTSGSSTIVILGGQSFSIDGQFASVALQSESGNSACRVMAGY